MHSMSSKYSSRFAASRLMAERSRADSSTAAMMASSGNDGLNRSNAACNRDTNITSIALYSSRLKKQLL